MRKGPNYHALPMPHSLNHVLLHIVFSTKYRDPVINETLRHPLNAYFSGIVSRQSGKLIIADSMPEHVHLLVAPPRTTSIADLVMHIKKGFAKWIKQRDNKFAHFRWQTGYYVCSVSPRHSHIVENYIRDQERHHKIMAFQDEYTQLQIDAAINLPELLIKRPKP